MFARCLLEQLGGLQKDLGAVVFLYRHPGLRLDPDGQRAGKKAGEEHDKKGDHIAGMSIQAEIGLRKEKVEGKHTEQRGENAIEAALCPGGGEKHPQNIDGDNIGLSEAQTGKQLPQKGGCGQNAQHFSGVFPGEGELRRGYLPFGAVGRLSVRDNVDIQIWCQLGEPVYQGFLVPPAAPPAVVGAAEHNLGHAAGPAVVCDLGGGVITIYCGDPRPQIFRQLQIGPQALPIFTAEFPGIWSLHEESSKISLKGLGHSGGGTDDFCIGGGAGQTDQDMVAGVEKALRMLLSGGAVEAVSGPAQSDLPQSGKVLLGKEVAQGLLSLGGPVDLALLEPGDQVVRLHIHHLDLVGGVKYPVWDPLVDRYTGQAGNEVV